MNLIEQLGGYEKAKSIRDINIKEFEGDASGVTIHYMGNSITQEDLEESLLEYRRQHSIFEEFDMLVYMEMSDISKIYRMVSAKPNSEGYIWMMGKGGLVYEDTKYLIHANDEEIAAGRRLP